MVGTAADPAAHGNEGALTPQNVILNAANPIHSRLPGVRFKWT